MMQDLSHAISAFTLGHSPDDRGRKIEQIWAFSDEQLENIHNYIQWLFPLREPSRYNRAAPILDEETIGEFLANGELRRRLLISFKLMLKFYGFQVLEKGGMLEVVKAADYSAKKEAWQTYGNHNYLRITRILTSLNLLGLEAYSRAFLDCLEIVYAEDSSRIGAATMQYWRSTRLND